MDAAPLDPVQPPASPPHDREQMMIEEEMASLSPIPSPVFFQA